MSPVTAYVVESFVTLLAVIVLLVLVLYGGRRLGIGRPSGPLELWGRLPLEGRRAVYLVKVGKVMYVLGASEAGLSRLGELEVDAFPPHVPSLEAEAGFAAVLSRLTRSRKIAGPGATD